MENKNHRLFIIFSAAVLGAASLTAGALVLLKKAESIKHISTNLGA